MQIIPIVLCFIFSLLGLIHIHWTLGGNFGIKKALPTQENGTPIMQPTQAACAAVAIVLLIFAVFYLLQTQSVSIPQGVATTMGWGIPLIFLLRAIGDFKYVGYFKKIKDTPFGKMDSLLFSPLCAGIAFLGIILQTSL